jgi:hypothetical protein
MNIWQDLPTVVTDVFRNFRTCEFSTLAKDGTPITWPTLPFWNAEANQFVITTSIGLPQKAFNVRRTPRVSLLFSDSTASGLEQPPIVLVQGDAIAPDVVSTSIEGFEEPLAEVFRRQPSSGLYSKFALTRYLFDWYYMRLTIVVTPRRLLWWERGDYLQQPHGIGDVYVA